MEPRLQFVFHDRRVVVPLVEEGERNRDVHRRLRVTADGGDEPAIAAPAGERSQFTRVALRQHDRFIPDGRRSLDHVHGGTGQIAGRIVGEMDYRRGEDECRRKLVGEVVPARRRLSNVTGV